MTKVIGSQNNVPDTGDPIVSPWYQDTATKLVHTFASTTARDVWTNPPNGAMCVTLDANILWQRIGGAWKEASTTGGFVGGTGTITSGEWQSTSWVTVGSFDADARPNRRYHVSGTVVMYMRTGTDVANVQVVNQTTPSVIGVPAGARMANPGGTDYVTLPLVGDFGTSAGGLQTIAIQIANSNATGTIQASRGWIACWDTGVYP